MPTDPTIVKNAQIMTAAILINGKKVRNLVLKQSDHLNPNWFSWFGNIGRSEFGVIVGADIDGSRANVCFDCYLPEEEYRIRGKDIKLRGIGDWKSVIWKVRPPVRATFPGEPLLPRAEIQVTLQLVSKPHLPRKLTTKKGKK